MSTPVQVNDTQIAEWRATRHAYKIIAAEMAIWARDKERGTMLRENDFFAPALVIVASDPTWNRAKKFLEAIGVLYRNDGPYQVA